VENAAEGADEVQSSITFELTDNVENLTLSGSDDIDGTGNDLDNSITGNSGDNVLSGGAGGDTLTGNQGADTFDFGARSNGTATTINGTITETITGPGFSFDIVTDFVAGIDHVSLGEGYDLEAVQGVGVTIEEGVNFELIGTAYDGTNATSSRFAAGQGTLILDSDGRLISDLNGSAAGYSVVADFQGGVPSAADFVNAEAALAVAA
jgi:Ca2+-binding RTX toxin-like protein